MRDHRYILAIIFTSIMAVGVAAGVKIAELDPGRPQQSYEKPGTVVTYGYRTDDTFLTSKVVLDSANADATKPTRGSQSSVVETSADPVLAQSYIVGDIRTGKMYFEKNSDSILPFASMSKLVTAIVASDLISKGSEIEITDLNTAVPADASGLRSGEKFTLNELIYPLLLNSSNVAAEAIASSSDRQKFLELMSSYSWEIGMPQAYFADPSGLSERNAGNARGFFNMAKYLLDKRPDILAITRTPRAFTATTTEHDAHEFVNMHPFVNDPRFLGGKTGHTTIAQDTMLTILNIDDHPIAIIVLKSPNSRVKDTAYLATKTEALIKASL